MKLSSMSLDEMLLMDKKWKKKHARTMLKRLEKELPIVQRRSRKPTFYDSDEWRDLRFRILKEQGRLCRCCKATNGPFHVDHIKPRSLFPDLALVADNLQVLCGPCNMGKSNKDQTDFR